MCCLLVIGAIWAAYAVDRYKTLYHFVTVDPGKLYRSGTLSSRGLETVYSMTHFKTIINLRSKAEREEGSWYEREKEFALRKRISLVDLPMLPDVPPDEDQIRQFLNVVTDPERVPVLVHCEAGVVRTGMMIAVYNVAILKKENRKVLEQLPMFGHSFDNRTAVKEFIKHYKLNTESGGAERSATPQKP